MRFLRKIADPRDDNSFGAELRRKRFALFKSLMESVPRPASILDVGGEQNFWEMMGIADDKSINFVVLNVAEERTTLPNFEAITGDARNMGDFTAGQFDIVFSNSVIEHVGDYDQQMKMALEVQRVGKRYFLQTPNRNFPLEPHFLFPFFQFLPLNVRAYLISHLNITYSGDSHTKEQARRIAGDIRLLALRELRMMFPQAIVEKEKLFGLTKSFMVYDGWDMCN